MAEAYSLSAWISDELNNRSDITSYAQVVCIDQHYTRHRPNRWLLRNIAWTTFRCIIMMASSNGNIFRVTGPMCGEFTGHRWIPLTHKGQWRGALVFSLICVWTNGWVNNRDAVIWDVITLIMTLLWWQRVASEIWKSDMIFFRGIHLSAISQEVAMNSISKICSEITVLKSLLYVLETNELNNVEKSSSTQFGK